MECPHRPRGTGGRTVTATSARRTPSQGHRAAGRTRGPASPGRGADTPAQRPPYRDRTPVAARQRLRRWLPAAFAGAVLFEPPVATGLSPGSEAIEHAKAAIAAGKPGRAMQIFVRDVVGMPASQAWLMRPLTAVIPKMRSLAPRQITDLEGLGLRLDVYAQIRTPVVLLGGERSPAHLGKSLARPAGVIR